MDLINQIPELLLFVIPGYISLKIQEKFGLKKRSEENDALLKCVLYSFIIGIVYTILKAFLVWSGLMEIVLRYINTDAKEPVYFILAVIFGYALVKVPTTKFGEWIEKRFNSNLKNATNVWIDAMMQTDGAWATVYLDNGFIYTGMLINYTADPNDEKRELLLTNYRLSVKREDFNLDKDFCVDIVDYTQDDSQSVYLSADHVIAIQIQTG